MNAAVAIAFVAALLLGLWLRALLRPLQAAAAKVEQIAAGDLAVIVEGGRADEIGLLQGAMASMVERLAAVIGDVRASADAISGASGQVSATAQALSQGTGEQPQLRPEVRGRRSPGPGAGALRISSGSSRRTSGSGS
jgi:methyl-accepting chemotaxis protein